MIKNSWTNIFQHLKAHHFRLNHHLLLQLNTIESVPVWEHWVNQLPKSSQFNWQVPNQKHLDSMLDLTHALMQPKLSLMTQALLVARVESSTQKYYDYFLHLLKKVRGLNASIQPIQIFQKHLRMVVWPDNIADGVKIFHDEILPPLVDNLIDQVPHGIGVKIQANYDKLMAEYDLNAWTRVYFDSQKTVNQHVVNQVIQHFRNFEDLGQPKHFYFDTMTYSLSDNEVTVCNPLIVAVCQALFMNVFESDHDLIIDQVKDINDVHEIMDWWLIWQYVKGFHQGYFVPTFNDIVNSYTDIDVAYNVMQSGNRRTSHFDGLGSLALELPIGKCDMDSTDIHELGPDTPGFRSHQDNLYLMPQMIYEKLQHHSEVSNLFNYGARYVNQDVVQNYLVKRDNSVLNLFVQPANHFSLGNLHDQRLNLGVAVQTTMTLVRSNPMQLVQNARVGVYFENDLKPTMIPSFDMWNMLQLCWQYCYGSAERKF